MNVITETEKRCFGKSVLADYVICALLMAVCAAAGCFSGSYSPPDTGARLAMLFGGNFSARSVFGMAVPVLTVAFLGSSVAGIILLPIVSAFAGFISGFLLAVSALNGGGFAAAFVKIGWQLLILLPPLLVFTASSLRLSRSLLLLVLRGVRPDREVFLDFFKALALACAAAVVTALCISFFLKG